MSSAPHPHLAQSRTTLDGVDVPLGGNATLRMQLERGPEGQPRSLRLVTGFGTGEGFTRGSANAFRLPGDALPALRAALDALPGEDTRP
ncbi:MAG: hypothetical protein HY704_11225 [Gemmatimonadetes bacterium]|nr:hypothetical protein [Gemmatimonadota bacterium]